MGTVGDALDNAVAESYFATLAELLDRHVSKTPGRACASDLQVARGLVQLPTPALDPRNAGPAHVRNAPAVQV
jgi:hypothetical protein